MRNSILGFKQEALCRLGMDMDDAVILRYFADFAETGKMIEHKHKGDVYYWLKYDAIMESLPILNISKDRIYRKLKKMVKLRVLKHMTLKENGTYSFYSFGQEFLSLKLPTSYVKNDTYPPLYNQQTHVENTITKDRSFNNSSFKENDFNKKICINIVEYLNQRANLKYSPSCEKTVKLISARLSEGFTEEDFKTVIDKKVESWENTEMCKYLRPQTLFGDKFEGYLNEKTTFKSCKGNFTNYPQRTYDFESLERKLLGWE
ncbi:phage conserved hypothetical protein, C-terminal domain-containing protein [Hathewaya proteolytica DSM 3090]|uniref:Phage conserved hypothetical protein C-terminal domain-containing protein n=1 Tax=Hathewaya proteolytica DSM 3090 TaxID=1121331 RepID=A0A1M6JRF4_9CLOT|nr:conserved phage C-terminal domain-containing protein [Hathewaya proteolytica]SHJ49278.1 phage conserved hypothetical protein, C-terminal domain-containing protein [Hathewaya proteolytica DSM 3090]